MSIGSCRVDTGVEAQLLDAAGAIRRTAGNPHRARYALVPRDDSIQCHFPVFSLGTRGLRPRDGFARDSSHRHDYGMVFTRARLR